MEYKCDVAAKNKEIAEKKADSYLYHSWNVIVLKRQES